MCGIFGFTGKTDPQLLRRMARLLRHRGPDARGFFEDSRVSLGCQRLRIRDPSPAADQPFIDDGGRAIVFNGELFNHRELRAMLEKEGYRFRTGSDTETLLAAYVHWGKGCFSRLDGMFATAIWDPRKKSLVLSRDSFGINPLYYRRTPDGNLFFASEMKALLITPHLEKRISRQALAAYLAFGCNPYSESMIGGIHRVRPGSVLTWRAKEGLAMEMFPALKPMSPPPDTPDALLKILSQAVEGASHDLKEYGLYLSGGVDSALLLALIKQNGGVLPRTYTAAFPTYDESSAARRIAEHFGTEHTAIGVEKQHLSLLPEIVWFADEALSDTAALPMYLLGKEASRNVKVVFTGDGGDELFYGYEQYRFLSMRQRLIAPWPNQMRRLFAGTLPLIPRTALNLLFPYVKDLGEQGILRARRYLTEEQPLSQYLAMVSLFDEGERKALGSGSALDIGAANDMGDIDALARLNSRVLLTWGMLPKADRMSMAHGVEARPPYLSSSVESASLALPLSSKLGLFADKICLRQAARSVLPHGMVEKRKHRFFVPIHTLWGKELVEHLHSVLDSPAMQLSGLSREGAEKIADGFTRSPLYRSRQIWALLSLLLWIETFIINDGKNPVRPEWW